MLNRKQLAMSAAILLALTMTCIAQETTPPEKGNTKKRVAELITDLDDSSFQVREKATEQLMQSKAGAIPQLVKATEHESLEVAVRALRILKELYLSGEDETVDRVESALEELAKQAKNRSIGARAAAILKRYYEVIGRKRAIADIERLGGKIEFSERLIREAHVANPATAEILYVLLGKDWKGGDEGLKYVKRMQKLRTLYLIKGVKISDKSKDDLQQALPNLLIQNRGPAFLGIGGSPIPNVKGCLITTVKEGAAADKAQLVPGDIIIGFGGKTVIDFDTLIKLIGEKEPKDKVKVDISRGGQNLTLVVELGDWSR